MSIIREHYDEVAQAINELDSLSDGLKTADFTQKELDHVAIDGKDHAVSCKDQYAHICDELDDLIGALRAELDNIDEQGGPETLDRAMVLENLHEDRRKGMR